MSERIVLPDYLFEISWEVCNKNGGIFTTIFTKTLTCIDEFGIDKYLLIGPWQDDVPEGGKDFIEDRNLLKEWRKEAAKMDIHFSIGRWNIPGQPIVILIKYSKTALLNENIAKYIPVSEIDPYLRNQVAFGLTAGMVIENYYNYFLSENDKIITHLHEAGSGSAALYLRMNCPNIGLVYTAHSTVLGRIAASDDNETFYSQPDVFSKSQQVSDVLIQSNYLLEKSVIRTSHVLTTLSDITARECKRLFNREPDVITPNGFEETMVPDSTELVKKSISSRKLLEELAYSLNKISIPENSTFIATSGKLEIHNKGFDVLTDALQKINTAKNGEQLVVFFLVTQAVKDSPGLINNIGNVDDYRTFVPEFFPVDLKLIPLIEKFIQCKLTNQPDDCVKIILIPGYIENLKPLGNISYYDLLSGFDLTVFPSYYEPWGYRPLESLAYKVPTITTSLSGFGLWINETGFDRTRGITVIERNDDNYDQVVKSLVKTIQEFINYEDADFSRIQQQASYISKLVLWENLFANYKQAYSHALKSIPKNSHN